MKYWGSRLAAGACASLMLLACAPAWSAEECEEPNLLIVLDKSGSMNDDNKWELAKAAVARLTQAFESKVRFGLMLFPDRPVPECSKGKVYVPPKLNAKADIETALSRNKPGGQTPISETLNEVALSKILEDKSRRNFLLFMTDGTETCAPDPIQDPVRAVERLKRAGVTTYVVGFGKGVDRPRVMSDMANAGGAPRAGDPAYYQADNADDLAKAFDNIVASVTKEVCDGKDNDCNGAVDDGLTGFDKECETGLGGGCSRGRTVCSGGVETCEPITSGEKEACDGWDNNCDGKVDENLRNACGVCAGNPVETCNGLDDDCDGVADNNAKCPNAGEQCLNGVCIRPCRAGECPRDKECKPYQGANYCIPKCDGVKCSDGEACEALTGKCVPDPCQAVSCGDGKACRAGACAEVQCSQGCLPAEFCNGQGRCVKDPCGGVLCKPGEMCRAGSCIPSCGNIACKFTEFCEDGVCQNCGGARCRESEVCQAGKCVPANNCGGCKTGEICANGACEPDPCLKVRCPREQVCTRGQCFFPVKEPPPVNPGDGGSADAKPGDSGGASDGASGGDDKPSPGEDSPAPVECSSGGVPLCCDNTVEVEVECVEGEWKCPEGATALKAGGSCEDAPPARTDGGKGGAGAENEVTPVKPGCGCSAGSSPAGGYSLAMLLALLVPLFRRRAALR
ncbi:MAG: hypothetical protein GMKNLPBB_02298 [Myxococcota bacterium]|nr:hypothetical protein [Myxococcota bacterium]